MTTTESPSFWNNLYQILQELLSDSTSSPANSTNMVSTNEPVYTTNIQTTTLELQDQGVFESFFTSLANNLVNIYNICLSSGWENSTMDAISDLPSYKDFFTKEVDILFQNYSLPVTDEQDLDIIKTSIVNALVSAWNSSLEIGQIPVVSPKEIEAKLLETLKGTSIFNSPVSNTTTPDSSSREDDEEEVEEDTPSTSKYPVAELDRLQSNFLAILKKAPEGIMGDSSDPFSTDSRSEETDTDIDVQHNMNWF